MSCVACRVCGVGVLLVVLCSSLHSGEHAVEGVSDEGEHVPKKPKVVKAKAFSRALMVELARYGRDRDRKSLLSRITPVIEDVRVDLKLKVLKVRRIDKRWQLEFRPFLNKSVYSHKYSRVTHPRTLDVMVGENVPASLRVGCVVRFTGQLSFHESKSANALASSQVLFSISTGESSRDLEWLGTVTSSDFSLFLGKEPLDPYFPSEPKVKRRLDI